MINHSPHSVFHQSASGCSHPTAVLPSAARCCPTKKLAPSDRTFLLLVTVSTGGPNVSKTSLTHVTSQTTCLFPTALEHWLPAVQH